MILLFDESGSPTNNKFHNGKNATVRLGTKYLKILEPGMIFRANNLKGDLLGYFQVFEIFGTSLNQLDSKVLDIEHDPSCRTIQGLTLCLQNVYKKPIAESEIVTAIIFKPIQGP